MERVAYVIGKKAALEEEHARALAACQALTSVVEWPGHGPSTPGSQNPLVVEGCLTSLPRVVARRTFEEGPWAYYDKHIYMCIYVVHMYVMQI